ncbi:MAG: putative nucleotidyltransferase [Granulosicoccus sp.]|jgi:predicted nucleotidyltransferase
MQILKEQEQAIAQLCSNHYVVSLSAFGSVLSKRFNDKSDIDLVVHFEGVPPLEYFNNYMNMKEKLEQLLGHEIDLIEGKAVKNPIFRKILERDMQTIYDRTAA